MDHGVCALVTFLDTIWIVARAILGLALVAYLPGHVWGRILIPSSPPIARFVTSVALSVAIVTIMLFVASAYLKVPIDPPHVIAGSLLVTFAGLAVPAARRIRERIAWLTA